MARRLLKPPQSLSGTSAQPTMVTIVNIMAMNRWLTSLLSMSISHPIPEIRLFQTLTLKLQGQYVVKGQVHTVDPVFYYIAYFSFHINQTNNPWDTAILKFDLETSKVKVMSEVKGQGHISYPVSNWCSSFSFHINRTNHSWDMPKIVFDLEKTYLKFYKKICYNNSFQQNFSKI